MRPRVRLRWLPAGLLFVLPVSAQFTHRYPKVAGFAHHIYLEGYNLPTLNAGPGDPAPSPDGRAIAISARGWLWLVDPTTREARRLTRAPGLDSRPAWSPDGKRIAFVRDDTRDTDIVAVDVASGVETVLVETPALDLDPAFTRDGRALLYASGEAGDIDLWRLDLASGAKQRLTTDAGLELCPRPLAGDALLYVSKRRAGVDEIMTLDAAGTKRVVLQESIASQMRPSVSPTGRAIVTGLPLRDGWGLFLLDPAPGPRIQIARASKLALDPAWSADGRHLYFVEADREQRFRLLRTPVGGGEAEDVSPLAWSWGVPTSRLTVRTRVAGGAAPAPARLHISDGAGHPVVPERGQPRFDSQNGFVYVYSPGVLEVELPAGEVRVLAARGFASAAVTSTLTLAAGASATLDLELEPLWQPKSGGWFGGDHHWHLNYGGPYALRPEDVVTALQGEDLDVATPQVANLHTRFNDTEFWSWRRVDRGPPLIAFAQEVRAHFLGHLGLVGTASPFWPWYWGPGYPAYAADDRPNADALAHARREGGIGFYVHPVDARDPFPKDGPPAGIPLALVPDAVMGDLDALEVACLWSDELGTSQLWYRLLNLGLAIAPSGGTDAFPNFYRSMAVGSTRVYVRPDGPFNMSSYLAALAAGRSFVTNGPLLRFDVGKAGPGDVIGAAAGSEVTWGLDVATPVAVDALEVLVNGSVVWTGAGLAKAGTKRVEGRTRAPAGGWIAARAHGGAAAWPVMDSYPFAHTAPIWFGRVGSREPSAARAAAGELLRWMDVADVRLAEGYGDAPIPTLKARFAEARSRLRAIAR